MAFYDCVCVCVCVCVYFLTTFSWIWQLDTEILMETSSVDETQTWSQLETKEKHMDR